MSISWDRNSVYTSPGPEFWANGPVHPPLEPVLPPESEVPLGPEVDPRLDNEPVVNARISDVWGERPEPTPGTGTFHSGIDYAVPSGTPVVATGAGIVVQVTHHANYGNIVVIQMDNGLTTASMHLQSTSVQVDQTVTPGQQIGLSGNTGTFTTGSHLHFTVWGEGANIPNFTNGEMLISRATINPQTVLPPRS